MSNIDAKTRSRDNGSVLFRKILKNSDEDVQISELKKVSHWTLLLNTIAQNTPLISQNELFELLKTIATNLFNDDRKYRQLYIDNKKLKKWVLSRYGGYEFLRALGFRPYKNKLISNDPNFDIVSSCIQAINKQLIILKEYQFQPQKIVECMVYLLYTYVYVCDYCYLDLM